MRHGVRAFVLMRHDPQISANHDIVLTDQTNSSLLCLQILLTYSRSSERILVAAALRVFASSVDVLPARVVLNDLVLPLLVAAEARAREVVTSKQRENDPDMSHLPAAYGTLGALYLTVGTLRRPEQSCHCGRVE